ncbi:MAG: hypothetical protein D6739_03665 [Nitrospirae bacterium]|nr:MAG: hypothetical protein D6739_03665 [Nitrospirota bacterium]
METRTPHATASPPPIPAAAGLLFLGLSLAVVGVLGWRTARLEAAAAALKADASRLAARVLAWEGGNDRRTSGAHEIGASPQSRGSRR